MYRITINPNIRSLLLSLGNVSVTAVDRPVESVKSCYNYHPLLFYDYYPVLGIRAHGIELLLSSNIVPRFKDTEHNETYMPSLS